MKCNCYICGKEFERKASLIERAEHPCCSRECANENKRREIVETQCCVCGKPLLRRKSRLDIRPNPTCSKSCKAVLQHRLSYDETLTEEYRQTDRNLNPQNRQFRKDVFERDNYTCQICGKRSTNLNAHHLNSFNWDVNNRYNKENGITLCEKCHKDFHKKYGMGNNSKSQFIEYANQSGSLVVTD